MYDKMMRKGVLHEKMDVDMVIVPDHDFSRVKHGAGRQVYFHGQHDRTH